MTQKHLESTRGMERYRAEKAGNVADEAARRVEAHKAAALSDFRAPAPLRTPAFRPGRAGPATGRARAGARGRGGHSASR